MAKTHGKDSSICSRNNIKIRVAIIILGLLLLACLIIGVIHPIISWAYCPPKEYRGIDLYASGAFREFEDGEAFDAVLNSLGFVEENQPVEFYYLDNFARDNLFYGKMCDVYAVDVCPESNYQSIKEQISASYTNSCTIESYELFGDCALMQNTANYVVVAFHDASSSIRVIMLTELSEIPSGDSLQSILLIQSSLQWETN